VNNSGRCFSDERGYLLVEISILIGITLVFFSLLGSISHAPFQRLKTLFITHQVAQILHEARFKALATDQTILIGETTESILVLNQSPISISQSRDIGFTSLGTTSRSGTITIRNGSTTQKVSLGIGIGHINITPLHK